jgi:hypothetical protein
MTRVLVTGSRDWEDHDELWGHLYQAVLDVTGHPVWSQPGGAPPADLVFVHGDYKRGADRLTRVWCERYGVIQDPHPAKWTRYGPGAGPKRNQEMVDLGADFCLAFPLGVSKGTRDCMRRADAAGIPVHNKGDQDPR